MKAFYPDPTPARREEIVNMLYRVLRNLCAHALGVLGMSPDQIGVSRYPKPNAETPGDGLNDDRLTVIEDEPHRPTSEPSNCQAPSVSALPEIRANLVVTVRVRDAPACVVDAAHLRGVDNPRSDRIVGLVEPLIRGPIVRRDAS